MGKPRDTRYYCNKCSQFFPVRGLVVKQLEQFNKKAFCPRCDSNEHTSRYKKDNNPQHGTTSANDPPSPAQLEYIKSLGGIPSKVKTKAEAGAMITKLKKLGGN